MNINFNNVCSGYMKTEKIGNINTKGYIDPMSSGKVHSGQHDMVSISPEAASFRELDRSTKTIASEVYGSASQEKINSLKSQISAGTYNISAGSVADAILERMAF
ncbi:MAG: flagellar biosynthesis anti-sigma factor FlgM [Ruminococcus sp.]|jgi:anti-sigma28 factor (negative regulator of flagellin synthesis)|nr:flagellar biosynthesis anti-sigma factor FlgM [Ruminococcus sp.]